MFNPIQTIPSLAFLLILSSFTFHPSEKFIGTYGVSANNPSGIELTLRADHTFSYQDFSSPNHKISVQGQWKQQGRKVFLKVGNEEEGFHHVWTFHQNGQVAKSRHGLCFYRLCKISS